MTQTHETIGYLWAVGDTSTDQLVYSTYADLWNDTPPMINDPEDSRYVREIVRNVAADATYITAPYWVNRVVCDKDDTAVQYEFVEKH